MNRDATGPRTTAIGASPNSNPDSTDSIAAARLIKPGEAAELLAIGSRKLWSMTNSGQLPCVRLGRSVRYRLQSLVAYIERREKGGRSR